ncbi:MAG: MarR family transcriptional regulator [Gammaproteobacteria bacterium]|nr:MarR family transcriptional regulator [Gammaproteobacteria bacterium]MCY4210813.1 MarR family transcriptional regulator [Gammaproteobacteria bacterium]MCY4282495.1 MarR family transcriptional regulator [Gammaproteobacteria bacterium]MCY4338586.1 MarR family transcriptional regulator [Gammaproteobacteria bacterium]
MQQPLRLETFLPYRLSLLSNAVSGAIAREYGDKFAISMPEWRILMILAEYPGIAADEVCRRTKIEKSVVSRAVARLLKRHLVHRDLNANDRRRSILRLSKTGLSVYDEVMPIAREYEQQLLANLDAEELKTFNAMIDKLLKRTQ